MNRFTSILIIVSLLLMVGSAAFTPYSSQAQTGTKEPSAFNLNLPSSAVVGSTAERQAAYDSLTPEEQQQAQADFRAAVEPSVNQAQIDYENSTSTSTTSVTLVQEPTAGQTVEHDSAPYTPIETPSEPTLVYSYPDSTPPSQGPFLGPCESCTTDPNAPANQLPRVSVMASPAKGPAPLAVRFTATATDPDGKIVAYKWAFGDNYTSLAASPSHTYQNPGTYNAKVTVTDNSGGSASATVTITVTPPPVVTDADGDGLKDLFEDQVADAFTPFYFISSGEKAGTGFATFQNSVPQTVAQVFDPYVPPSPISYFRVKPLGIRMGASGIQYGYLQVDYLTLWNRDDGLGISVDCVFAMDSLGALIGFNGDQIVASLGAHALDNERSAVLLAAPIVNGTYNTNLSDYRAYDFFTASHEGTISDKSRYVAPSQPVSPGSHVMLALARSKHGTYTFNPNGLPLTPGYIIAATYATIDELYYYGYIGYTKYLIYLNIADRAFFSCFVERFQSRGGRYAEERINVGEVTRPLNNSTFIQDTQLSSKLNKLLWRLR